MAWVSRIDTPVAGRREVPSVRLADHIRGLNLPIVGGRPILEMATGDDFTGQVQHGLRWAGTIVGGTISAAVASTFTLAIGNAWAVVCGELTQGKLKGADGALDNEMVRELFQAQFAAWFKKQRASFSG